MALRWIHRLRSLPLRSKVMVTVAGAAVAVLGASTFFSFRYWQREILAAGEQQVLWAGHSVRATLESTLSLGRTEAARHAVHRLMEGSPIVTARVRAADGRVILSADPTEEGHRERGVWLPETTELDPRGLVRAEPEADLVRAWFPLDGSEATMLELGLSVESIRTALRRGAMLGVGLLVVSVLALGAVLLTMLEREVIVPWERMEERAEERERRFDEQAGLAEVGELASEMAHEFKRPLASVRTAIDLLQQEYELNGTGRTVLDRVEEQLERLDETMKDLFSIARPIAVEGRPVDAEELLEEALLEVMQVLSAPDIRVERERPSEPVLVSGDPHRLGQAFRNVLFNAVEAMPGGGTLTLSLEVGPGVALVRVSDTGEGIPPEEVKKALRPFYSTKPLGTGLGLPLVARIVAAHGGTLELGPREDGGRGTTVEITLPKHVKGARNESRWASESSLSTTTT